MSDTGKKIYVKQTRSINDTLEKHKRTIKALGLGRPNYVAVHNDTPAIRGMINRVSHLVEVTEEMP
ncbi:MAG: 50S ribosomal protein L30 [Candidatus Kapaibacterium sp.]|jgi:large subunit ribosomal protein L30